MPTPILITVIGHVAGAGTVVFTRHRPLTSSVDDTVIPPGSTTATLDEDGDFTVQLYATNDPDWEPVDLPYSVRVNAGGGTRGSMLLDYQDASVEFADVLQVAVSPSQGHQYVPLSQLGADSGVATLGADGVLSAGQRPDQAVDSVNGFTGSVVLVPSDIGIYVGATEPVGAADGDIWFDTSGA